MQYLGLAVKYFDDEHAYVVTPDSYRRFVDDGLTWRWPSTALAPGLHFVDVAFRASNGGSASPTTSVDPARHRPARLSRAAHRAGIRPTRRVGAPGCSPTAGVGGIKDHSDPNLGLFDSDGLILTTSAF